MNMISKLLMAATATIGMSGIATDAWSRNPENSRPDNERKVQLKTTAGQCNPAAATIDLDINNVRARLMTGGDMWWDRGTSVAKYEIPKGSGKSSLFAGSIWVGGYDEQNALKVAAQLFRTPGNDYYPGPTAVDRFGVNGAPDKTTCTDWDKFWKIDRATLLAFREEFRNNGNRVPTGSQYESIIQWPATGNQNAIGTSGLPLSVLTNTDYRNNGRNFAPFVDVDGDGAYNLEAGDYPDILGDQYVWWVFNDMGNAKLMSGTLAIGMEVQTSAFAFSSKDYLNDASFVFYKLINRGTLKLTNTYMATWTDADLGFAADDYVGCDTARSLGILYNGKSIDGNGAPSHYGSQVPMVGVDFFIGPKRRTYSDTGRYVNAVGRYDEDTLGMAVFNYFNLGAGPTGDPTTGTEFYRIMTGFNRVGAPIRNDQAALAASNGYGPGREEKNVFFGEPNVPGTWSECQCGTPSGDRRFVHSSGPFTLEAGGITNDIIIGVCWVPNVGGCPNTNFTRIRAADDLIQDLFDNKFRTIDGPEAPRLVVREMDRKLIFYIVNDSVSTNFQEKYGYDTAAKYRVSTPKTRRYADSLYKFEGYRIFQLRDASVNISSIFNQQGEVNTELAAEVFQTDIKNGVGKIINYVGNPDKAAGFIEGQVKVDGKDSGLIHSFQLNNDAFGKGEDKRFVNYRNYYFVAIAYAYNNFRQFNYQFPDSTQMVPYLESSKTAGGRNIPVVSAMPNPANGDMGTVVNSDYGSGVIIKRLEGIGNGGNATTFDFPTEAQAMTGPDYQAKQPVYTADGGPVSVKVIDPRLVQPLDWELYITGTPYAGDSTRGIQPSTGSWRLVASDGTVIYNERNLTMGNEQIAEKYGLSINIAQVLRPGDDNALNNGYITSTITFSDPARAWLAGVKDGEGANNPLNWIRSGSLDDKPPVVVCEYDDKGAATLSNPDSNQVYENLLANSTPNAGTWAPVTLAAVENKGDCGFGVANAAMIRNELQRIPGVDIVFTSDKTKWTKSVVLELQDDITLAEGNTRKLNPRSHRSWTGDVNSSGLPVYSTVSGDTGYSYFPGYAINQETGERVNIVFGEDSYLKTQGGSDMIWNPTNVILDPTTNGVVFGGKHYIYILNSKYDEGRSVLAGLDESQGLPQDYSAFQWVGLPTLLGNQRLLPLSQGLIPNEARIRIRVARPFGRYIADASQPLKNNGFPLYQFSTKALAPQALSATDNKWANDKQALLDQIHASPNPYYGYVGYENNRLDTRVRIVNLPRQATVYIYSLDGTLVRTLTKDNANQSYIDWDTRNAKGLTIASGMYLMHVKADGIGETIIRWFGAFRPVDITTY